MKVLFLTVIPSPYQRELFRALKQSGEFEIAVYYYAGSAADRLWKVPDLETYETILQGVSFRVGGGSTGYLHPSIRTVLRNEDADLTVVADYSAPTAQLAMSYLTAKKKPWVFWGEIPGFADRGRIGRWIRRRLQAPLNSASAIAAIGERAVEADASSLERFSRSSAAHIALMRAADRPWTLVKGGVQYDHKTCGSN